MWRHLGGGRSGGVARFGCGGSLEPALQHLLCFPPHRVRVAVGARTGTGTLALSSGVRASEAATARTLQRVRPHLSTSRVLRVSVELFLALSSLAAHCAHVRPRSHTTLRECKTMYAEGSKHAYTPATRSEARSDSSSQLPTDRRAPDASRGHRWGVPHSCGPAYVCRGGRAWNKRLWAQQAGARGRERRWQSKGRLQR